MNSEITVLIATRNRPQSAERAIRSVLNSELAPFEVIVVDNAPDADDTETLLRAAFADDARVRYVNEPVAGLARAHNTGLRFVRTPLVAITDDDVVVDASWLTGIADAFATSPRVVCVTGGIRAAELETSAQRWAENHLGFHKGASRTTFNRDTDRPNDPLFPFTAGAFGSGANMSFRVSFLHEVGGFDVALGAGSLALGGDDLAVFYEVIRRGYSLVYEPSALVNHFHHRTVEQLERQVAGYGVGLGAFLTKVVVDRPLTIFPLAVRTARGLRHLRSMRVNHADTSTQHFDPRFIELHRRERLAVLRGPVAYFRSRWATRQAFSGGSA